MTELDAQLLEAFGALGGAAVATIGLIIVILQLHTLQQSVRSAAHSAINAQAADFRAHLVAYPQLRRFFFEGDEIAPDHDDFERALTIAELFLNYLEQIAVTADSLGRRNRPALDSFVKGALDKSPLLRQRLSAQPWSYSPALAALA